MLIKTPDNRLTINEIYEDLKVFQENIFNGTFI